jgi:hypothetical protein
MIDPHDIAHLMEPVATTLLGTPNAKSKNEWRYGTRGSLAIDLKKGVWHDHERGVGGGVLDLIRDRESLHDNQDALHWIEAHGLEIERAQTEPRPSGKGRAKLGKIVAYYPYFDENSALLYQVVRYDPKTFRQRRPDPSQPSGWSWSVKGIKPVPYRLPELIEAIAQEHPIVIVEGEREVETLVKLGVVATCNSGGAGKWGQCNIDEYFRGADVVIIGDVDPQACDEKTGELRFHKDGRPVLPGQDHAADVARHLSGIAKSVRMVDLSKHWPDIPPKADISKWLALGYTREDLDALIAKAEEPPQPTPKPQHQGKNDEEILAELNRDNAVVLDAGRTRVLRFEDVPHEAGGEKYIYHLPTFLRFDDFRNFYLNRYIDIGDDEVSSIGKWWLATLAASNIAG